MGRKKNIIFVGFDIESTGGISTYSRYQIKALKESFNNVFVYSLDQQNKRFNGYVDISYSYTNKIVLFKLLFKLIHQRKGIDLIIFNHVNISFIGALLKKLFNIKYIVFGYNNDLLLNLRHLYKFGFENADSLIIDCRYTIDRLKEFHNFIPKTHLLYDPVDINFFKGNDKSKVREKIAHMYNIDFTNKFIITTVSLMRKNGNKGHRVIINSIAKMSNTNILYFIIGTGEDKNNLELYAKIKGLEKQVIFFGYVENNLVPDFYNVSDIVTLISKNEYGMGEGVPLGLIEASACGIPILAGNEDGSYEAISCNYQNGFRVNPRDVDEVAEFIQFYIDNPDIKTKHGLNGREFIIETFEYNKFRALQTNIINSVFND